MQLWPRIANIWLLCAFLLGACSTAQTQSAVQVQPTTPADSTISPTTDASAEPTALAEQTFASGTRIAGIDVGGMTAETVAETLRAELASVTRPLQLRAGDARLMLRAADIDLELPVDAWLAEAQRQAEQAEPIRVPLEVDYDAAKLREQLTVLAAEATTAPALAVITSTDALSRSFAYIPGYSLDIDAAMREVEERLLSPQAARRVNLKLQEDSAVPAVSFAQIEEQVNAMAQEWYGIVGFYLYDLNSGETVTRNENTVFSGASVMKVPIMLQSYITLPTFDADQKQWMRQMIVESDNLAANQMLAAAASGMGTEDALVGAEQMNETLQKLGLQHTYQYMPYEAADYLITLRGYTIKQGPPQEGSPPYTEADPVLRTTPAEISRLFLLIDQCSQKQGELLDLFPATLSARRCQEMLDLLAENEDTSRMVSGLPAGTRAEHKSGWIEDMQADVGIVRSPGGDFLLAVYLYQESDWLRDEVAAPVIGDFARLVYTAYNPIRGTQ